MGIHDFQLSAAAAAGAAGLSSANAAAAAALIGHRGGPPGHSGSLAANQAQSSFLQMTSRVNKGPGVHTKLRLNLAGMLSRLEYIGPMLSSLHQMVQLHVV